MPNFWALKNLQKGQQVCLLNFNFRTSGRDLWALSAIFRLSSHPKKILAKFYYPKKIPESKAFWEGAFWSENGYRLCLSGIHGFRGNYGSLWTYLSFQFQIACENVHFSSVWRRFKRLRNKEKYANSKWILTNLFCFCSNLSTVLVRLRARGAYLLLVPQSWRALIRERALFSLLRNNRMLKTKL